MSALWGEMKVTAQHACHMPGSSLSTVQSARTSSHVYCTLLPWIDVCFVSGTPKFVTLIACISIQHGPGAQCKMESNWTLWWYAGRGGEK